jgi:flagellin-specific chaperone FliS
MRKTEAPVVEVERLIGEIRSAWAEMLRQRETGGLVPAAQGVA